MESIFLTLFILFVPFKSSAAQLFEGNDCIMKSGERGVCTKLPACGTINDALRQGIFRLNHLVRCSFIDATEVICCPNNGLTANTRPTTQQPLIFGGRRADKVCAKYEQMYSGALQFNIVSGPRDFPHMAALGYPSGSGTIFRCAGSLISSRYVLTAAHCVQQYDGIEPTIVRFGSLNPDEVGAETLTVEIEEATVHPEFSRPRMYHDIALIRLSEAIPLNSQSVFPGCLYTGNNEYTGNKILVETGWRKTSAGQIFLRNNLTTVEPDECNKRHQQYDRSIRRLHNDLIDGQFCAYDINLKEGACPDIGGGPLQETTNNKISKIWGVLSLNVVCGSMTPALFSRVSYYLDWMEKIVWPTETTL